MMIVGVIVDIDNGRVMIVVEMMIIICINCFIVRVRILKINMVLDGGWILFGMIVVIVIVIVIKVVISRMVLVSV